MKKHADGHSLGCQAGYGPPSPPGRLSTPRELGFGLLRAERSPTCQATPIYFKTRPPQLESKIIRCQIIDVTVKAKALKAGIIFFFSKVFF